MSVVHFHIILGWFRTGSEGIRDLGERLRLTFPESLVTEYDWQYPHKVVYAIKQDLATGYLPIPIGFSLGANCCTWAARSGMPIPLLVAYDPTWLSRLDPIGKNVAKTLWYHSTFYIDFFGHGTLTGHNIERIDTVVPHMAVQHQSHLHAITLKGIREVIARGA